MNWRNADTIEWYGRQMSMFSNTNGTVTYYTYNADGIRTEKQSCDINGSNAGTVKYTLDGSKIVAENRNGTNLYYLYDDKGAIMGISYGNNTYTFAKNIQGDVIGIYNGSTLVAKYQYNAYGQIMSITNASGTDISNNATHIANINPFRYRGYYYDNETGFYYLQTRYYDPVVGRFLNADALVSTGQGILGNNMFAYCNNNPVNRIDPYGLCSTASDIKACLKGANCCDHNHCTADYLMMCRFGDSDACQIIIRNAYYINSFAEQYGVDPVAIAGAIYAEQMLNVDWKDSLTDWMAFYGINTSVGIGQVRLGTARMLEDNGYVTKTSKDGYGWNFFGAQISVFTRDMAIAKRLENEYANVNYDAAYLSYLTDAWCGEFPDRYNRIDILVTLYNNGKTAAHSNPIATDFGIFASKNRRLLELLLG